MDYTKTLIDGNFKGICSFTEDVYNKSQNVIL